MSPVVAGLPAWTDSFCVRVRFIHLNMATRVIRNSPARRGFTLIELLVVILIIATVIGILLPALGKGRRNARTAICQSNMRQASTAIMTYAVDFKAAISAYSWKVGDTFSQSRDLNLAQFQSVAHANQCVDILRRRLGRGFYYSSITDRIIDRNYSHLPLIDGGYFSNRLAEPAAVCPEDRDALIWQRNPDDFRVGLSITGDPDPTSSLAYKKILPFWSTYQFVPYAFCSDASGQAASLWQSSGLPGYHLLFNLNQTMPPFSTRRIDEVAFPSQKVAQFDIYDRHYFKRMIWYAYPVAAQPLVFFDGSVSIRKTGDANPGWDPLNPRSGGPTTYQYWPSGDEPPTLNGAANEQVSGYYRWTRNGLGGVDYGGKQ